MNREPADDPLDGNPYDLSLDERFPDPTPADDMEEHTS